MCATGVTGLLIVVWLLTFCSPVLAAPRRILGRHIPAAAAQLRPIGALPATNELKLAIGLPLRNRDALTNLLAELYTPAHPNYRHFLTPSQFTARFGPTKAQYEAVIRFARTNGMTIVGTHANRLVLDIHCKVGDIQRVFHTTLRSYPHPTESRSFYAPDTEPSVEPDVPILDITGLNNFSWPHPKSLSKSPSDGGPGNTPKGGSGTNGTYLGNDFRKAYAPGVTLTGTDQVVGLLEFDGYYTNDITTYESLAGLPNVPLEKILLDGYDGTPTPGSYSANNEVALDIEVTAAMAPGLSKILVYEAGPSGYANDIISRMACDNQAAQLSCSWDFGSDANATTDQIFLQMAAQGQSFFNASGDSGAYVGSVPSPDDNPYITLVGGTTLTTTAGHAWVSETTWNAGAGLSSSGGFSSTYPLPDWQEGISMSNNQGSTTKRNIPDVSMVADDISIVADNGQQYPIYGTSAASPLWAAFTALINQHAAANGYPRVGFLNPTVYSLAKGTNFPVYFHDITTGNNTNRNSGRRFLAVAGYDLCTGWGTPNG
ncbi:MAG: S53 family peptidase, partial [Limisphaerales bacterium]